MTLEKIGGTAARNNLGEDPGRGVEIGSFGGSIEHILKGAAG